MGSIANSLSTPVEALAAVRGIHNNRFDGLSTRPYARLAYKYSKSAHVARLGRIIFNNVSPDNRNAAFRGNMINDIFSNGVTFGLFWSSQQLALLSLSQIYRVAAKKASRR
jgi:hypothetical protein